MPTMLNVTTLIISSLALVVGAGVLWVHYRNLIDRRHSEISRLRADHLRRISDMRSRLVSCQTNVEVLRLEVRKAPEIPEKYAVVEKIPNVIAACEGCLKTLAEMKNTYIQWGAGSMNSSTLLHMLHGSEATFDEWAEAILLNEQAVLAMLVALRKAQGAT